MAAGGGSTTRGIPGCGGTPTGAIGCGKITMDGGTLIGNQPGEGGGVMARGSGLRGRTGMKAPPGVSWRSEPFL